MRTIKTMAAALVLMLAFYVSISVGTASAKTLEGTAYGDTIYGYGGADLAYGYGAKDLLYGGNETGRGDKLLGGTASDLVLGQKGDDALYGQGGGDEVSGSYGNDLVVGGGEDALDGGPGSDRTRRSRARTRLGPTYSKTSQLHKGRAGILGVSALPPASLCSTSQSAIVRSRL